MKITQIKLTTVLTVVAITLLSGCAKVPAPMPEVNNANCKTEEIKKIKDKNIREEFAGLCMKAAREAAFKVTGPTEYKPNGKVWTVEEMFRKPASK